MYVCFWCYYLLMRKCLFLLVTYLFIIKTIFWSVFMICPFLELYIWIDFAICYLDIYLAHYANNNFVFDLKFKKNDLFRATWFIFQQHHQHRLCIIIQTVPMYSFYQGPQKWFRVVFIVSFDSLSMHIEYVVQFKNAASTFSECNKKTLMLSSMSALRNSIIAFFVLYLKCTWSWIFLWIVLQFV